MSFVRKAVPYAIWIGLPLSAIVAGKEGADVYSRLSGNGAVSWSDFYQSFANLPLFAKISGIACGSTFLGMIGYAGKKISEPTTVQELSSGLPDDYQGV